MPKAKAKSRAKPITVSIQARLRSYTYTAALSPVTGRLLRITAGCRTWKSFEDARAHYRGEAPYSSHWAESQCSYKNAMTTIDAFIAGKTWAYRREVRDILDALQNQVAHRQRRFKKARK